MTSSISAAVLYSAALLLLYCCSAAALLLLSAALLLLRCCCCCFPAYMMFSGQHCWYKTIREIQQNIFTPKELCIR